MRQPVNSVGNDLTYLLQQFRNTFSETGGESPVSFSNYLNNIDYIGIPLDLIEELANTYNRFALDTFVTVVLMFDAAYIDK